MIARPLLNLRWAPEVILALAGDRLRFNQLLNLKALEGISDRVLTERLRDLADVGLVERDVELGPPVHVSYSLTPAGLRYIIPLRQLQQVDREVATAV